MSKLTDFAMVTEAWHLPTDPDSGDGRHSICLDNVTLLDEEWSRSRFPFAFFRWEEAVAGFWGTGLVEQVTGDQVFINKVLSTISRILHLCSVPRVLWPVAAGLPEEKMTNSIGSIIEWAGSQPPQIVAQNAVPSELFGALKEAIERGINKVGQSQLSTSGMKPAGLDSGAALREQQDIETDRLAIQAQDFEQMAFDVAEILIDEAEAAASDKTDKQNIEVNLPSGQGMLEKLSWKDVDLDRESYALQLYPTSSLPQQVSARKQTVAEWQQAGWIDAQEARRLMDIPDLEASNNMALAAYEDVEQTIQDVLDGKPYASPEPMQDLELLKKRAQQAYLRAKRLKAPEPILENLDKLWNAAKDMMDDATAQMAAKQAAAAPQMGPGGPPGGGPALPPGNAPPMVPPTPQAGGMAIHP